MGNFCPCCDEHPQLSDHLLSVQYVLRSTYRNSHESGRTSWQDLKAADDFYPCVGGRAVHTVASGRTCIRLQPAPAHAARARSRLDAFDSIGRGPGRGPARVTIARGSRYSVSAIGGDPAGWLLSARQWGHCMR